ncbi:MAG: ATPase [Gammaproteobacteria bacterium]|nr:ATPase [Gammaproteobacteria bacterium]
MGNNHRRDKLIKEREGDSYRLKGKLAEPTVCPYCSLSYQKGRWQWAEAPKDAHKVTCPACQRTQDKLPAGVVTLAGEFMQKHKREVIGLIKNIEENENKQHPLNRIMEMNEQGNEITITTTDTHLPRSIGVALEKAYKGELDYQFTDESNMLRVRWSR